ncbi:PadR family transcriptional regulator [Amycolatopsis jiangsuensis]|uniref:DNA-binding PadR family transcriptional regulator n=1 Tax=Amycolatopsis jiangsuensis TaxID=1181879 RepID=A0A840J7H3_9PSEU|nr:PadR family transcriptional regulator [Amycolatopsis jiangsuensis]MBB4689555.1 DNA-binding PadR family transcriptional regulator [Amycolatopsis jiangsuensis]
MAADEIRLSPTSYVVLGLIHLRGASTPYELEAAVQKSVEFFWKFPHSQLYREPARLAASGHLDVEEEAGGRRRKFFTLTSLGRSALQTWLAKPVDDVFEMRDEAVLRLFFSDSLPPSALVELAEREISLYERRLERYRQIAAHELPRHGHDRRMAPLRLGVKLAEAFREFWEEISLDPPPPSPPPDRRN